MQFKCIYDFLFVGNIESKFDEPGFRSMNVELRYAIDLSEL